MSTPSRFDYVKYDETAVLLQEHFKEAVVGLERALNGLGVNATIRCTEEAKVAVFMRSRAVALTKLEEFYMWVGKAVRDEQIIRNGSAPLQEERKDG